MENRTVSTSPLDSYQYEYHKVYTSTGWNRIKEKIGDFLCFCAGADTQILAYCPHSDRIKEQGIGGVVLATTVLAFFSGSYAFYTVFSPKVPFMNGETSDVFTTAEIFARIGAATFGFIWALIIFNLDRFIVASTGHGDGTHAMTKGEFVNALPRFAMAIVIGLTLSKPLEIKIMESEINFALYEEQKDLIAKLNKQTQEDMNHRETEIKGDLSKIEQENTELLAKEKALRDAIQARINEEARECSTEFKGDGPLCKKAGLRVQQAKKMLEEYKAENKEKFETIEKKRDEIAAKLDTLVEERESKKRINEAKGAELDGLIKRIELADEKSPWSSRLLTLLLITIEIAPIFFKMMLQLGPYDFFSENQRRIAIATRGIRARDDVIDSEGKGLHLYDLVYEEAERITKHEAGKLQTDQYLTEVLHQRFREVTEEDIKANLNKYMEPDRPTT
jgi:hypothetical protein